MQAKGGGGAHEGVDEGERRGRVAGHGLAVAQARVALGFADDARSLLERAISSRVRMYIFIAASQTNTDSVPVASVYSPIKYCFRCIYTAVPVISN